MSEVAGWSPFQALAFVSMIAFCLEVGAYAGRRQAKATKRDADRQRR